MRVAYVTQESCGFSGHAVRGIALVRAARRAGVELRAFGPPLPSPTLTAAGYEGSDDWRDRVTAFAPELLIGDISWVPLDELRATLGVPAWLLVRGGLPIRWLSSRGQWSIDRWERRISIEPTAIGQPGVTDAIPPIVAADRGDPVPPWLVQAGFASQAGFNSYWESAWLGYRDRVRWLPVQAEQAERVRLGGEMSANGADVLMSMT